MDDALHAPPGLRFERHIGDPLLIVTGVGDQWPRARALAGPELDEWRRRLG